MKKHLLSIIFCFLFLCAKSQLILNSNEMLPFGSVMTLTPVQDLTVIDTTIKGANAVWNFSGITNGGSNLTVTITNPALTPYGSSFPASNYAYAESPAIAYRYFTLNSAKMERVGSYSGTTLKTYSDPQIEYVFPLGLGTTNQDTWANDASSFGGNYNITCLGTGTLTLPGGAHYNALFVRADVSEITTFPTYFWYSADNGAVLLEYVAGDGIFYSPFGQSLTALTVATTTGINNNNNKLAQSLKYNNPVQTECKVSFSSERSDDISYSLTNPMGEIIRSGNCEGSSNDHTLLLDFNSLASGMYYLLLKSSDQSEIVKLVKN
jgi:hypothetical protein